MTDLVWRKEPPDGPGWWWVKAGDAKYIVRIAIKAGVPMSRGWNGYFPVSPHWEWAGPIPLPKEAK